MIVPEEWQLHPLPQSPPTHFVPLPDMEIDLPEEMLQPIPPKIHLRSLWRDFERTNYRLKELRRVIHSWEPKLTAMGGTVMEHHRVLTAVTTEVAQAQHTLFRQLEAARQEVENLKAQNLQLLQFQQQIQASVGNISQQVSKIEQLQGLTQHLQGELREVKNHLEGLQVRVHTDSTHYRQWEERMAQELELRFRTEQTQVEAHLQCKSGIPIMCNPCGLVLMRWRETKKRKPNPPELPSMI